MRTLARFAASTAAVGAIFVLLNGVRWAAAVFFWRSEALALACAILAAILYPAYEITIVPQSSLDTPLYYVLMMILSFMLWGGILTLIWNRVIRKNMTARQFYLVLGFSVTVVGGAFAMMARWFFFESWVQLHYRLGAYGESAPAFMVLQRDLWWTWLLYPVASFATTIFFFLKRLQDRSHLAILLSLSILALLLLGISLCAHMAVWLTHFGRIF